MNERSDIFADHTDYYELSTFSSRTAIQIFQCVIYRMADDEEVQALVVDNGSGMCKVLNLIESYPGELFISSAFVVSKIIQDRVSIINAVSYCSCIIQAFSFIRPCSSDRSPCII